MKLSVKSDYAARAVLSLARRHASGKPTRVDEIAAENGVPANYLTQILIELKGQNIVRSQRGKDGGYLLARHPAEISLGDILNCMYGGIFESPALHDPQCPPELQAAWRRLAGAVTQTASGIHFQQLAESASDGTRMFYI